MFNFFLKKYYRLLGSKKILKLFYLYHKIFGEKYLGNLDLDFSKKKGRAEIIQNIIDLKDFKSYLEIGTYKNEVFDKIKCKKKIGVDPVSGGNIRMTSDNFFKVNQDKFDIIFIDGLHTYKQVKKDILNSINCLRDGGVILLHDCLPLNYYSNAVPRCTYVWSGDVWKAFVEMRTKDDLDCYCCYADQGIGVILKRKNKNQLTIKFKKFSDIKFNYYFDNYKKLMCLKEYNEIIKLL